MDLLIIKSDGQYVQIKNNDITLCSLDKASVFPMDQLDLVKQHLTRAKQLGLARPALFKLILKEEPFSEGEKS